MTGTHRPNRSAATATHRPESDPRSAVPAQPTVRIRGRDASWLLPALLLVVLVVLDLRTNGTFRMLSWIVVVPALSAAMCGVWTTTVFTVLTVAVYLWIDLGLVPAQQTGSPGLVLIAVGGALSVAACGVRIRHEQLVRRMRTIAETTRDTVLRPLPPLWGSLDHAAVYLAADSEARMGGDFFDIQPSRYGTRVLLGDVQGKGLGAVAAAAALLGTFREAGYHEPDPAGVAARLDTRMRRHCSWCLAMGREDSDRFATAVLIGFPAPGGVRDTFDMILFGHEPPLIVGPAGVRATPDGDGLPLGLGDLLRGPGQKPRVARVELRDGETLLMVTDGVTEARDATGDFYPLRERVERALADDPRNAEPERLVRLVRDETLAYTGGRLTDDTTILAVRPTDDPGAWPGTMGFPE